MSSSSRIRLVFAVSPSFKTLEVPYECGERVSDVIERASTRNHLNYDSSPLELCVLPQSELWAGQPHSDAWLFFERGELIARVLEKLTAGTVLFLTTTDQCRDGDCEHEVVSPPDARVTVPSFKHFPCIPKLGRRQDSKSHSTNPTGKSKLSTSNFESTPYKEGVGTLDQQIGMGMEFHLVPTCYSIDSDESAVDCSQPVDNSTPAQSHKIETVDLTQEEETSSLPAGSCLAMTDSDRALQCDSVADTSVETGYSSLTSGHTSFLSSHTSLLSGCTGTPSAVIGEQPVKKFSKGPSSSFSVSQFLLPSQLSDSQTDEGIVIEDSEGVESEEGSVVVIDHASSGRAGGDVRSEGYLCGGSRCSAPRETVRCCGMVLSEEDVNTLLPGQWLNDQVINCYLKLVTSCLCEKSRKRVQAVSTFFYTKLRAAGFKGVQRWLKHVDPCRLHLLLVPVHLGCHWCLAAIDFKRRRIEYYDSLGGRNPACLKVGCLLSIHHHHHHHHHTPPVHKKLAVFVLKYQSSAGIKARVRRWRRCYAKNIPQQCNSSDCGVFVCQFAHWICFNLSSSHSKIPFSSKHMLTIRQRMRQELKEGRLTNF